MVVIIIDYKSDSVLIRISLQLLCFQEFRVVTADMNLIVLWMMWHCYFLLALFLSSNATNCRRPELCTSSLAIAPIAMTGLLNI